MPQHQSSVVSGGKSNPEMINWELNFHTSSQIRSNTVCTPFHYTEFAWSNQFLTRKIIEGGKKPFYLLKLIFKGRKVEMHEALCLH